MSHLVCINSTIRKTHRQSGMLTHLLPDHSCPTPPVADSVVSREQSPVSGSEVDDGVL